MKNLKKTIRMHLVLLGLLLANFCTYPQSQGENYTIENAKLNNRLYGTKSGGIDTLIAPGTVAGEYRFKNLADPVLQKDAVNIRYVEANVVPYTGANADVFLGSNKIGSIESIVFNPIPTVTPENRELYWDDDNTTLAFHLPDGGDIQVGQEPFDYYTNLSGVTLVDGDVVSIIGASGNRTAMTLTDSQDEDLARATVGMVTVAAIGNNNSGRVTKSYGKVRTLNTAAYAEGTTLWVDPANPGKWTATKPNAPYRAIRVGTVTVSHAVNGVVDLAIQVFPKLKELADVDGIPLTTTGQFPVWHQTEGVFDFDYNISNYLLSSQYTASDVLTKIKTVDGTGSGLDADLLDGQHGNYYSDIVARLGYTPVNKAGDTFAGTIDLGSSTASTLPSHYYHRLYTGSIVYTHFYPNGGNGAIITKSHQRVWDGAGSYKTLEFTGDGIFRWNNYNVFHSGNANLTSVNWAANTMNALSYMLNGTTVIDASRNFSGAFATFSSTIQATTAKLTTLSDGYIPYHASDATGLFNSSIMQVSGNIGIGTSPQKKLHVNGDAYVTDSLFIGDKATKIHKDDQHNLTFYDINAGTYTLSQLVGGGSDFLDEITITGTNPRIDFNDTGHSNDGTIDFYNNSFSLMFDGNNSHLFNIGDYQIVNIDGTQVRLGTISNHIKGNLSVGASEGSNKLNVFGNIMATGAYRINETTVIDDSRNISGVAGTFTGNVTAKNFVGPSTQSITYSSTPTLDWNNGNSGIIILTGDVSQFTLSNVPDNAGGNIVVIQNATGGYGVNNIVHAGLTVKPMDGQMPTAAYINSAANGASIISYQRQGSYLFVNYQKY